MTVAAKFELDQNDAAMFSDVYKSAHGFRPRDYSFDSQAEFDLEMKLLFEYSDMREIMEKEAQERAYDSWIASVHKIARDTGNRIADVVRWQFDAEGMRVNSKFDREHFCFKNYMDIGMEKLIQKIK